LTHSFHRHRVPLVKATEHSPKLRPVL
jgi:hypothetical protein